MAKDPKKRGKEGSAAEYYKLKTGAVDDLVTADESNAPRVSKEELERYGARKKGGAPSWLKVCFAKWWFAGAVYWFIAIGLVLRHPLDQVLILGIVMGMVSDLLTDNMIRFMAPNDGDYDGYLMFAKKRYLTFPLNLIYAVALCAIVLLGFYPLAGLLIDFKAEEPSFLAMLIDGPVGFGLFYVLCDMALVGVKNLIKNAVQGAKNKNVQEG